MDLGDRGDRLAGATASEFLTVHGGSGADAVTLTAGRGELDGGPGEDVLTGSPDHTELEGGKGADVLRGGAGYDRLVGDPPGGPFSADQLDGGTGGAVAVYTGRRAGVSVDLQAAGPDGAPGEGDLLTGVDSVHGGRGPDVLRGDGAVNLLVGALGDDRIDGRGGNDQVNGGTGADRLAGGPGDDFVEAEGRAVLLDGGDGDDRLLLRRDRPPRAARAPRFGCGSGRDVVSGFAPDSALERGCERFALHALVAALDLSALRRGVIAVRLANDSRNAFPPCQARVELRAVGRPRTATAVRLDFEPRNSVRARIVLSPLLRRALRRRGARLEVRVRERYSCRSRRFEPEDRWRVALGTDM